MGYMEYQSLWKCRLCGETYAHEGSRILKPNVGEIYRVTSKTELHRCKDGSGNEGVCDVIGFVPFKGPEERGIATPKNLDTPPRQD